MSQPVNRRTFLSHTAAVGAGFTILKSGILKAGNSPNEKLNIAAIGVGGRGADDLKGVSGESIVALCDVNEKNLAAAAKRYPQAKTYSDWRKCLDQKDIDAVVCATTDHTHAFINVWAMNRGKHVYCEKPLANSVQEARLVRKTYLKNKDKLSTQMGTQIHASDNYRRMVELIRGGAIGKVEAVHVWCSRTPEGGSYLPQEPVPPGINWDLWIGPSRFHPFNSGYIKGGCLSWNRFWDFGSGQIGDMGSHMMDMAYWALDLRLPTSVEAQGSPLSTDTCPQWLTAQWTHPANNWRGPVTVNWYDGGKKPGMPSEIFDRDAIFKAALFRGDKGFLMCDYTWRVIMPTKGDMTQYTSPKKEDLIPPSPGHHQEWIIGCKTGKAPLCNFDYAGAMIENNLLALVSYRLGQTSKRKIRENKQEKEVEMTSGPKLEWDARNLRASNNPEADKYITKTYRQGWVLNG
jgi:predicted dehydrogenase